MAIDERLLKDLKRAVRVTSGSADGEIEELVEACKREMALSGVHVADESEPLCRQAIKLYCKAHYGYDENTGRYLGAYQSLRDSMALSGEYGEAGGTDGG